MDFGKDQYPKWTEKEEMTFIFLCAFQPDWSLLDVQMELNTLFGNDRSPDACTERKKKNDRAITALRDLVASNPITIAKFWKRTGVVSSDVTDDHDPMIVCDADTIREVISGGFPAGKLHEIYAKEEVPRFDHKWSNLFNKVRRLFPEINEDMSEDSMISELEKRLHTPPPAPVRVKKVTPEGVEFDGGEMTVSQLREILQTVRDYL